MKEKTIGICDQCGKKTEVVWTNNPYIEDLYPDKENPDEWWCNKCHQERCDDI